MDRATDGAMVTRADKKTAAMNALLLLLMLLAGCANRRLHNHTGTFVVPSTHMPRTPSVGPRTHRRGFARLLPERSLRSMVTTLAVFHPPIGWL